MDWGLMINWAFAVALLAFVGSLIAWCWGRRRREGRGRRRPLKILLAISGSFIALYLGYWIWVLIALRNLARGR